jgi:oligopeptide transport system substrate-binding protein
MLRLKRLLLIVVVIAVLTLSFPLRTTRAAGLPDNPVTLYSIGSMISSFDPQVATDADSITPVVNMFIGLTDMDPKTSTIRPAAATKWSKNDAGDVWTFTIRDDIPWVHWDPSTQEATEVRKLVAGDFEYGIKRACDPRLGGLYTRVAAAIIKGCDVVANLDPGNIQDSDFDQIAVKATSDTELQITTQGPLPFFIYTSSMWMFRAVPKETIDQFGNDQWTNPGNIVTDGPYLLDQYDPTVSRTFVRNTLFPTDVFDNYGGNIDKINVTIVNDSGTAYSLYQNNEIDAVGAPQGELDTIRKDPDLSKQLVQRTELATSYFGFMYDKKPFDNVHVRRAFSAALDRNTFVSEVLIGRGLPIGHFMPPGIRGAVGINEIQVGDASNPGYDPEYAKSELALGGYPGCKGFPNFTILTGAAQDAEYLQNALTTVLGCDQSIVNIEETEFTVLLQAIKPDVPTAQRPAMFSESWGADYPDAQNWMFDVLSCKAENDFKRPCSDIDKKIDLATHELDPQKRDQLYRDIETGFFAKDGEFPIVPLAVGTDISLVKPWYTGQFMTDGLFGGSHWDTRHIDQDAQTAARKQSGAQ